MSLLLPDSGLLFWMLLSFGVVFVVLAKYGFPVITKMVEGRKTYIDQSLEVAREANAQLSKLKEESEALIAAANKEQGRILREAMHERDKIIVDASRRKPPRRRSWTKLKSRYSKRRKRPSVIFAGRWQSCP